MNINLYELCFVKDIDYIINNIKINNVTCVTLLREECESEWRHAIAHY